MEVRRSWLAVVCLSVPVAGCKAVGPDYHGPGPQSIVNAPTAQQSLLGARDSVFSANTPPDKWWQVFNAPVLDGLEQEAFSANRDIRVASANLERSAALLRAARAARQPSVAINVDPSYQQLSAQSYLDPSYLGPLGIYDAGIAVSYDLDLFGRLRRVVEAAEADEEAVKAGYELALVNVAAETARAYADVCSAGEQLSVAHRSLDVQTKSTSVIHDLVESGRSPVLDYTRSSVLVSQIQATIPGLEARRRSGLYRLAVLTGRTPAEYPKAIDSCEQTPRVAQPLPVGDGAQLLRRRPDVRQAERLLAAATARIGVATADLYPEVILGVGVGSTGALTSFLDRLTNRYALGVGVQWEANQSMARARIGAADATAKAALARFDGVVLVALRDTETALTNYAHEIQRDDDLAAADARAREAAQQAARLYAGGKLDFLSLLDTQRTLTDADAALAASHSEIASDQITVFLTLGGGWR